MKLFPVSILLAATTAFAETPSVKVFVNGRPLEASVIETNGTFYLPVDAISKALGVQITIKTNEVRIVREPAPLPTATTPKPQPSQPSPQGITTIRGVLSFHNNVFDPNHSDPGAQVWLVKEDAVAALALAAGGKPDEPIPTNQTGWDAKLTGQYKFPRAVADELGRFAFENIAPGAYLLITQSRQSNGLAARDRKGKMRFKKLQVGAGQIVDGSFNFGPTAYREP